tara:strand:- start:14805 stop:17336 length:2532 start_codon:yes stop_codon:yes gene_type:complete
MIRGGMSLTMPRPGVQERILLHLRDFYEFSESIEVPFSISQMGIANAVSIARSNVPRAIGGLKDEGLLVERQAHIAGVSRKRKAYFLTDAGMESADRVFEEYSEFEFTMMSSKGPVTMTIGAAPDHLSFPMRIVDIIRYLDESGVLDMRVLSPEIIERDLSKHIEKQLVNSLADLPRTRLFYGRETELDNMVALLDAKSTSILVPGIAGIGKTSMAGRLIEEFTHQRNLLYHRCQDWDGSRAFLDVVGEWLLQIGSSDLADYLHGTSVPQIDVSLEIILSSLESVPALIVIDDLHKVNDEILIGIIRGLTTRLDSCEKVGLVLFSRSYRMVVPQKDSEGRITTLVMPLDGLDQQACRHLLTQVPDLDPTTFLHLYNLSRGHPLVLQLINRGGVGDTFHDTLENFIEEEIFSRLSGGEKRLLGALAVFRDAVPMEAISKANVDIDLVDGLVEKGLARQISKESFDVHDLIREFLTSSMDDVMRKELHENAASHYRSHRGSRMDDLEFLHHLAEAGNTDEFAQILGEVGQDLVSAGHTNLLTVLDSLDYSQMSEVSRISFLEIKGDLLILQNRWLEAESCHNEALPLAKKHGLAEQGARLLSSLADIEVHRDNLVPALKLLDQSLAVFIETGDAVSAARTYLNVGSIHRRLRKPKKALEAYDEVEKILQGDKDNQLIISRIRLASVLLDMNKIDSARNHAMIAHDLTLDVDHHLHARARTVLGRLYSKTGDLELAAHHYSEALTAMSQEPDHRASVEIKMLLGEVMMDTGRAEEAMEYYLDALALAEANDHRMLLGEILARLGSSDPNQSSRMSHLQRALTVFREIGANDRMMEVQASVYRALLG